jgi:hypothetical protein
MVSIMFQFGILAGYAYALLLLKFKRGWQMGLHGGVMSGSLGLLLWGGGWGDTNNPFFLAGVGGAYLILSSTSPLIQSWIGRSGRQELNSVYRLFAFSNLAGIVMLFSYPFVIESNLGIRTQATIWTGVFLLYAVFSIYLAYGLAQNIPSKDNSNQEASRKWGWWIVIPGLTTVYLLSISTAFTQAVPAAPFLWTVPLGLYLLSYSVVFGGIYSRNFKILMGAGLLLIFLTRGIMIPGWDKGFGLENFYLHNALFFIGCLILHGELYRIKPGVTKLALFYLSIGFGGLLGGVSFALLVPLIFNTYSETWFFHFLFVAVVGWVMISEVAGCFGERRLVGMGEGLAKIAFFVFIFALFYGSWTRTSWEGETVRIFRNFHGAYRVVDRDFPQPHRALQHGGVNHGWQFSEKGKERELTAYYTREGGLGLAFENISKRTGNGRKVICVGTGAGVVAAWGEAEDIFTFIDIDPNILKIAERDFSFINSAKERGVMVEMIAGDGRKMIKNIPAGEADLVILDAFLGGAIPVHLLTKEALAEYINLLNPTGILAIHVSSSVLNLVDVVQRGLALSGVRAVAKIHHGGENGMRNAWILATKSESIGLALSQEVRGGEEEVDTVGGDTGIVWTDDFSPIFPVLKSTH